MKFFEKDHVMSSCGGSGVVLGQDAVSGLYTVQKDDRRWGRPVTYKVQGQELVLLRAEGSLSLLEAVADGTPVWMATRGGWVLARKAGVGDWVITSGKLHNVHKVAVRECVGAAPALCGVKQVGDSYKLCISFQSVCKRLRVPGNWPYLDACLLADSMMATLAQWAGVEVDWSRLNLASREEFDKGLDLLCLDGQSLPSIAERLLSAELAKGFSAEEVAAAEALWAMSHDGHAK